ncbi:class I SAM-dependent methyltransferase [Desulfosporosinus metallidurans]|uniref:Class I SAM-dependent methyltransferase n=1 Tax=Desulfosporosinus metallidurans TaxID=1888891 RepID=A0A1Q8QXU9_9FIRM|nr:class I SAM-dependent methyltransferase [Desulfosporosinus metallidurans]OLN32164.1 hypothetical protein DSOL_2037 [Desulfosporosinus metallidurans]
MDEKLSISVPESINTEDIMREIRDRLANEETQLKVSSLSTLKNFDQIRGASCEPVDNNLELLNECVRENNQNWDVNPVWPITSHRKVIGPIMVFGKRIVRKLLSWYVARPWQQQFVFNSSVTRSINELVKLITSYNSKLNDESQALDYEHLVKRVTGLEMILEDEREDKKLSNILEKTDRFEDALQGFAKEKQRLGSEVVGLNDELLFLSEKIRRLERSLKDQVIPSIGLDGEKIASFGAVEFDYFMFEQRFRGSCVEIKERQRVYLDFFKGRHEVLDIGCGRGEFLELMRENGIRATGVDSNPDMVAFARSLGADVVLGEAKTYLKEMNSGIDGIFSAQLIEHLSPAEMLDLIRVCYDKLDQGGVLVLETVNPTCLSIFAESFYMDLSHIRPVHPATLAFVLKEEGFVNIQTLYLSPFADTEKIPNLPIEGADEFNAGIERLNSRLFSYRDYAIIGVKR